MTCVEFLDPGDAKSIYTLYFYNGYIFVWGIFSKSVIPGGDFDVFCVNNQLISKLLAWIFSGSNYEIIGMSKRTR